MAWVIDPPLSFSCTYEAGTGYLRGSWAGLPPDAELRAHYSQLLATAYAHGHCRYWLLDLRRRAWPVPALGRWFGLGFAETVQAVLGRPMYVAYMVGPGQAARAATPGLQAVQQQCARHGIYLAFFDAEAAARDWLAGQQAADNDAR